MALIELKLKHGRTFEDARGRLSEAVEEVRARFGPMIRRVEWSPGRDAVAIAGPGVKLDLRVDPDEVHLSGDIPLLASLLGSSNLKQLVESTFQKP